MSHSNTVTLTMGDGGAATLRFIKEQILARFGNKFLNQLEDSSYVPVGNTSIAVTTDSYIVDPPIFPGGNIGQLAISGTINDLVASGARPLYVTFGLILAEGFPIEDLYTILDAASTTARLSNVQIVTGDTKVVNHSNFGIIINTVGIGIPVRPGRDYALENAQVGDDIIITGTVGDHGLAVLSQREGLGFEQRVHSDVAALDSLILGVLDKFETIHCLRDPTRGGILNALIDLAESSSTRVLLDRKAVPLLREVEMGCELLGLDPLSLLNEGKMLLVVDPTQSKQILAELRQHALGQKSTAIGKVVTSRWGKGELVLREGSTEKLVTRPEGDAIPRLC